MTDPLADAISRLASVLERLGIRYAVVGSLASSAHGHYRATADGDLLAHIPIALAQHFADALGSDWYVDAETVRSAIEAKRSFNVIHIPSAQKIDIFPAQTEFEDLQLERATVIPIFGGETRLPVASAEDVVLAKLQWYRAGGEVSEKQWRDIAGVLAGNGSLDDDYLVRWANRLRVDDLLAKARAEAEEA
jgi:hypothetical protein